MPSLLTDADFNEIRAAIKDVTDTFMRINATYKKASKRAKDLLRETADDQFTFADVSLPLLEVWEDTGDKSMQKDSKTGSIALDEGYCLVNYADAETAGLASSNNWTGDQHNDKLVIDSVEYDIIGINPIGQLKDEMVLFKIHIKRQIRSH